MPTLAAPADLPSLRFPWPWRPYQQRVLSALPSLLTDRRLHVVAAPGSGKTVLGLEIFRVLGRPTVVLSPTRTIRDQWLARLGDFLPPDGSRDPDWAGTDLADLSFFTSLTYQALHTRTRMAAQSDLESTDEAELAAGADAAGPSKTEVADVVKRMRDAGIGVIILDEAHHLRADWWAAISAMVAELDGIVLVALTGTPPYDVLGHEWTRYIDLCGPIDEEISTPELVKAGTLCPHDDYVWLVPATTDETRKLQGRIDAAAGACALLQSDAMFVAELSAHPWARDPVNHLNKIMAASDSAMALTVTLHACGATPHALLQAVDLTVADLPPAAPDHWQAVVREYLYGPSWEGGPGDDRRRALSQRLRQEGLLHRRELSIAGDGHAWPRLTTSAAKIDACGRIHELESRARGSDLRQVVLTDFIRDDGYADPRAPQPNALGAWPVFHRIAGTPDSAGRTDLALHTGRLTLVHRALLPQLETEVGEPVPVRAVAALPAYADVSALGSARLTGPLTRLLTKGAVRVIVGTRALLGEGWDAPAINSLVLASTVGSFMTTNQMRGRAIRTDPAQPDKVASMWHLGTYAQLTTDRLGFGGEWHVGDLRDMGRRFDTFVGLAHDKPIITTGLERLRAAFYNHGDAVTPIRAEANNAEMERRLLSRLERVQAWRQALDHSDIGRVLPAIRVPEPPQLRPLRYPGTMRALLWQLAALAAAVVTVATPTSLRAGWLWAPLVFAVIVTIFAGPRTMRMAILYFRHLPIDGALQAIALAVRDALVDTGQLPVSLRKARALVRPDADGVMTVALGDGTFAERSLFADCVHQVLAPITSPRYLITRAEQRRFGQHLDFHAVPSPLATHADRAAAFLRAWRARVGPAELLYTRSEAGRAMLVRAQARAWANASAALVKRMDRWF